MPRRRALRLITILIGALVVFGARPDPAASVAAIALGDQTSPSDGETLPASPAQLALVFTTPLVAPPGVVIQTDANSPVTAVGEIARGDDAQTWYLPLTTPLPNGSYTVTWKADGAAGTYTFTIGTGAAAAESPAATTASGAPAATSGPSATTATGTTPAPAAATPETAKAANVVARWISYLALGSLLGGLLVIATSWGEGVEYVLTVRFLRLAWVVALAGTVLNIACTRAVLSEESLLASLNPGSWSDLTDDLAGLALLARFAFVLATGWVVFGPERVVDEATQIPALLAPAAAVATFGFTRAQDGLDLLLTPAGVIHALAFAAWFGGLVLVWRVVLAGSGESDLVEAVRGFSRIATPALLAVVASGVLLTAKLVGGAGNLFTTGYGRLLLMKTLAVAAMAFIGVINRQTVHLRLDKATTMPARTASRLRRALGSEMLAGVLVLGFTGWMVGSVPEGLPLPGNTAYTKSTAPIPLKNAKMEMVIGIGPQKVGSNDVEITLDKPTSGIVEMEIRFDPIDAYVESVVIDVVPALTGKGVLVVDDAPFNAAGQWKVTVTGRDVDDSLGQLESTFVVAPAEGTETGTDAAPATTVAPAG